MWDKAQDIALVRPRILVPITEPGKSRSEDHEEE
jgi:hypothetical protein